MHIAIEGMDGAGKTSQAKLLADRIGGEFIAKSFHEMHDTSGVYDNFVTIDKYTSGSLSGIYGIRQNFFFNKLHNKNVVTDRFYISNYWSRAEDLTVEYFKRISLVWGEPDLMIILYADPKTLYERIYNRNNNDKDLVKPQQAEKAYELMFDFVNQMNFSALVINNSNISFEEASDVIFYAYKFGLERCLERFPDICRIQQPRRKVLHTETGKFVCVNNELIECMNISQYIKIPKGIEIIRDRAFCKCSGKIQIEIPKTVNAISAFAFEDCNIEYFVVDNENLLYTSLNGIIYDKKITKLIKVPNCMKEVNLAEVVYLANCSLTKCNYLERICIPSTVEKVGYATFSFCSLLENIEFTGSAINFLAPGCFFGCERLKNIDIDSPEYCVENNNIVDKKGNIYYCINSWSGDTLVLDKCKYVYPYAFYGKINATNLYVNIRKIGAFAFKKCNIKNLFLEKDVVDVGEESFLNISVEKVFLSESTKIQRSWNNSLSKSTNVFIPYFNQDYYVLNRNWRNTRKWVALESKEPELSCGSACIYYMLKSTNSTIEKATLKNMFWIFEIINYIENIMNRRTKVYYNDSCLMNDYYKGINKNSRVMRELDDCIKQNGEFFERKITGEKLVQIQKAFKFVIMCVCSERLFGDNEFKGNNHYVLLENIIDNQAILVSPGKDSYYKVFMLLSDVLELIQDNGQWIIGVENDV